jgi:hypothetical protein
MAKGFPIVDREADEAARDGVDDNWHWQRGYDVGARDLDERRIENDRLSRQLEEAAAETVRIQDDLGRLLHSAENDRDTFRRALLQLHRAIRALGATHGTRTFFECSPLESRECFEAWFELNEAQAQAADVLPSREQDEGA